MNTNLIKSGYKYQVGYFSECGNYTRFGVFKNKPSNKTLFRIAKEKNCPVDRLQAQILQ
jgi:hypothetical protein